MDASRALPQGEVPSDHSVMVEDSIDSIAVDIADNEVEDAAAAAAAAVGEHMPTMTRPWTTMIGPVSSVRIRCRYLH